jgi:hypothetical protein
MNDANRPSETEEALARFVAQQFDQAPRLQASSSLWKRIEADLLPSLTAPGNLELSEKALAEDKPQIHLTQLGLSDAGFGAEQRDTRWDRLSASRPNRNASPVWYPGLFSMAAMLVLLALPWAMTRWSALLPGGLDTALEQVHATAMTNSTSTSPEGRRATLAQEWSAPVISEEQAFDDETLTWLASLGEITEEVSF